MRKSRFSEEQTVKNLREADKTAPKSNSIPVSGFGNFVMASSGGKNLL
jgi:hypothetical protein